MFAHLSSFLPLQYLRETDSLVAFHHPRPSYPVHILLLPKRAVASLLDLSEADADFMMDLFACVRSLVVELDLAPAGYRLIANGCPYQEIPQLHFHLISGEEG